MAPEIEWVIKRSIPWSSGLRAVVSLDNILDPKLPLTAVLAGYERCVIQKALCIEALYECVWEWVDVTCTLKLWVVNKTRKELH